MSPSGPSAEDNGFDSGTVSVPVGNSSRRVKKRKTDNGADASVLPETNPSAGEPSKRKRNKVAGTLSELPNQHLDILFEIFEYLHPYNLLKLARTTKAFQRLLLSHSSRSVWKAALKNVPDLPECPPDLTEPQWVNLVFFPHCHFCLCFTRTIEWEFRVRMCSACANEHLCDTFGPGYQHEEIDPLDELDKIIKPNFELLVPKKVSKRHKFVYFDENMKEVKAQYYALKTEEEKRACIEERRAVITQISDHTSRCEIWLAKQANNRSEQLDDMRRERRKAILEKLKALGYEQDYLSIRHPDSLTSHKLVNQPRPLTERVWNNIKAPLIQFMEEMRAKRIQRENFAIICGRKVSAIKELTKFKNENLPCTDLMPEAPDFCDFPPVKELIERPIGEEPTFSEISPLLPDLITSWRAQVRERFMSHLFNNRPIATSIQPSFNLSIPPIKSPMTREDVEKAASLATTVFCCVRCSIRQWGASELCLLFYPEILGHACFTRTRFIFESGGLMVDPSKYLSYEEYDGRANWDCNCDDGFISWEYSAKAAKYVVRKAKLDPNVATTRDMDSTRKQFACLFDGCVASNMPVGVLFSRRDYKVEVPVFGWRDAVYHLINEHTEDEYRLVAFKGSPAKQEECLTLCDVWKCTHCRDSTLERPPSEFNDVKFHLDRWHNIAEPAINRDYYLDYEAPNIFAGNGTMPLSFKSRSKFP